MIQPDLSSPIGLRDRAILELFYSSGIRRMEVVNIAIYDVNFDRGVLMIRKGKGKKDRVVPVGQRAMDWIEKYMYEARPLLHCAAVEDNVLFLSVRGTFLNPDHLTALIRKYVEESGIPKKGACHIFRHTMATLMLDNGADIRHLQEMLGHADIKTTQIYTHVSIPQLKKVHEMTHPANRGAPGGGKDELGDSPQKPEKPLDQKPEDST
jgi:integrase/recombinase XerD